MGILAEEMHVIAKNVNSNTSTKEFDEVYGILVDKIKKMASCGGYSLYWLIDRFALDNPESVKRTAEACRMANVLKTRLEKEKFLVRVADGYDGNWYYGIEISW